MNNKLDNMVNEFLVNTSAKDEKRNVESVFL